MSGRPAGAISRTWISRTWPLRGLALKTGIDACMAIPAGGHDFGFWKQAFSDSLPWLSWKLKLTRGCRAVALLRSGVEVAEHVAFRGLAPGGVETSQGRIDAGLVVLTGGPKLAAVGRQAGLRIPAGGVRHQVAVTERHRTWIAPGCRWCSTWPRGCTGGPRRAACCSG